MYSRALPTDTPSPIFSEGSGRPYTGYLERIIHLQTVHRNWGIKSGGLFIQNSNYSIFKLRRITYLMRIIKRITRLTRIIRLVKTAISVIMNVAALPWVGRLRVRFCFFSKIIFKLTIDITICKIIFELKYLIKSVIYQMLKFLKRIACFITRWSEDLYFDLKLQKIQVN